VAAFQTGLAAWSSGSPASASAPAPPAANSPGMTQIVLPTHLAVEGDHNSSLPLLAGDLINSHKEVDGCRQAVGSGSQQIGQDARGSS
jgi:hypothetical protein